MSCTSMTWRSRLVWRSPLGLNGNTENGNVAIFGVIQIASSHEIISFIGIRYHELLETSFWASLFQFLFSPGGPFLSGHADMLSVKLLADFNLLLPLGGPFALLVA